jgi:hypothetical protein
MSQTLIVPRHVTEAQANPKRVCGDCRFLHQEGAVSEFVCTESPPQVTVILAPAPAPRAGQLVPMPFASYPPRNRQSLGCGRFVAKLAQ